jgi:KDO2-lipid IV(A) lauroyltransferase
MALYLVIQIGAFLSRYIPRPWRYLIGTAVGDLVFFAWGLWGNKRKILLANTATVLGLDSRDRRVRHFALKSIRNYCKYLVEFLDLPNLDSQHETVASMKITGLNHLQDALSTGKGVILASAHFGTIEVGGLRLADFTDFHAVYDTFHPEYLDRLIQRKRREKGINLVAVSNVRGMIRVLRSGGMLTMLFDRPVPPDKGVEVHFFGRRTAVPAGPALLAKKTGAVVLPVFMYRQPDRSFESVIYPPLAWNETGEKDKDLQVIMQRLMDILQSVVRARPDQWYMFRPMWPQHEEPVLIGTGGALPSGSAEG